MFETLGLENWTPREAALVAGLALGIAFGALAQLSRFCLRRGLTGPSDERRRALIVWIAALASALLGTQLAVAAGWLSFAEHRFHTASLPIAALTVGGLLFGVGMMLTRGCISRLTVLSTSGNLRALIVLGVFAIGAHATLKGVLAPLRTSLAAVAVPIDGGALLSATGGIALGAAALLLLGYAARRTGVGVGAFAAATALGLLVPGAWLMTGMVLYDDFDPLPLESLSFTLPHAETLFYLVASTALEAGFGVGLITGVLIGGLVLHVVRGQFRWQSFTTPGETVRYVAGGLSMGVGGVLAGGCTVGAGLAGLSTLGASALIALASIVAGGALASRWLPENRHAHVRCPDVPDGESMSRLAGSAAGG